MKRIVILDNIKKFAKEKYGYFALIIIVLVLVIGLILSMSDILPDERGINWHKDDISRVLYKDGKLIWFDMDLVPISRDIKKEFDIPRSVKGMFVIREGNIAKKLGLQPGDVICSINRKHVYSRKSFTKIANNTHYFDGFVLDIYRDGKRQYVTIPFFHENGPLFGQLLPYGKW